MVLKGHAFTHTLTDKKHLPNLVVSIVLNVGASQRFLVCLLNSNCHLSSASSQEKECRMSAVEGEEGGWNLIRREKRQRKASVGGTANERGGEKINAAGGRGGGSGGDGGGDAFSSPSSSSSSSSSSFYPERTT